MTKYFLLASAAVVAVAVTGCLSPTRTNTYYRENGTIERTEASESVVKSLMDSTKDKTIIMYDNSWLAYISASAATTEDPTPTLKMGVGKSDKGLLSIKHPELDAKGIVEAARASEITISATGVSNVTAVTKEATNE